MSRARRLRLRLGITLLGPLALLLIQAPARKIETHMCPVRDGSMSICLLLARVTREGACSRQGCCFLYRGVVCACVLGGGSMCAQEPMCHPALAP